MINWVKSESFTKPMEILLQPKVTLNSSVRDCSWRSNAIPTYLYCIVIDTNAVKG